MTFQPELWVARLTGLGGWQRSGLAFVAGVVSALGFAPLDLWPATLMGLALLVLLLDGPRTLGGALGLGWCFGLGHFMFGQRWIAQAFQFQSNMPPWMGWVAVFLLSMLMAGYVAVSVGIAWRFQRDRRARLLAFAGVWMLTEWLRGFLLSGFPWNPLGVTQLTSLEFAQVASVVGGLGLSGLTVLAGGGLALSLRSDTRPFGQALVGLYLALGALGVLLAGGADVAGARAPVPLAIVQPNIGQDEKWSVDAEEKTLARYEALSRLPDDGPPRLLIWPEAALTQLLDEEAALRQRVAALLRPGDLLLTGALKAERDVTGRAIAARNSLYVVDHRGLILARYDKAELVPFGEFVPLRSVMEAIGVARLAPGALDFWPGSGPRTLALPGYPSVSPRICYEIIFAAETLAHGGARPGWVLNSSNDAWFSDAGAEMHLAQARLRAIEYHLPIARATPTGISAVIDAEGRVTARLPRGQAGVLRVALPAPGAPTWYGRTRDATPLIEALALIGFALGAARWRQPQAQLAR